MGSDPLNEDLGKRLDERLQQKLSGQPALDSVGDDVAKLEPVVSALATLAILLDDSFSEEAEENSQTEFDDRLPAGIGKYVIERCLGRGGQSIVFLAKDPDVSRSVVIKLHITGGSGEIDERLLSEARNLARVQHPVIAQCYGVDRFKGLPYLVMEYIRGRSLQEELKDGTVEFDRALQIVADLADGLSAVHRLGILHGDIKPANVMIGENGRPRLVDFGFSRAVADHGGSSVTGTPAYMAPEQARHDTDRIDVRADVFGLGAVLYELLTGRPPYKAETQRDCLAQARSANIIPPQQLNGSIPAWAAKLCMQCLAADPAERIDSQELRSQILKHSGRRRRRVLALCVVAAVAIGFAGRSFLSSSSPAEPVPSAQVQAETEKRLPDVIFRLFQQNGTPRSDFPFDVEIVGHPPDDSGLTRLQVGDIVEFDVESARDSFVTILSFEQDSDPVRVYPLAEYESYRDAMLTGGESRRLPEAPNDERIPFKPICAELSTGPEAICVIASSQPLILMDGNTYGSFVVFETAAQKEALYSELRSLTRKPADSQLQVSVRIFPLQVVPAE